MAYQMLHRFSQAFYCLLLPIRGFVAMACWHWTAVSVFLRLSLRVVLLSPSLIWFCFSRWFFVRQHQLLPKQARNILCSKQVFRWSILWKWTSLNTSVPWGLGCFGQNPKLWLSTLRSGVVTEVLSQEMLIRVFCLFSPYLEGAILLKSC